MFGLSTHNRQLACEVIHTGWNPVMVRHSLAHRGAEEQIIPLARETGVSLITFNNTCYGRLLDAGPAAPSAAECYHYSLNQPGVGVCLTAPSTIDQLRHNLTAPSLEISTNRLTELKSIGDAVYRHERNFLDCVRSVR